MLAGGLAAQHTTVLLRSDFIGALLVASLCALAWRRARAPAWFVIGFSLFLQSGSAIVDTQLEPAFEGDSMLTTVRVTGFPKVFGQSLTMLVEPLDDPRIPLRTRVSWFEPPVRPLIGDVWELELRLRRPRGNVNPGVFDYETWLFRERVHATGYVVAGKRNRLLWSGTASRRDALRQRFIARAGAAADSSLAAAILAAVGTGTRHLVAREQWDDFAATGTSHLMAISGLHVGLAALVAFVLVFAASGLLHTRGNSVVAALGCGVLIATAYAWVSGFGVPAQRALVMLAASAATVMRRRQVAAGSVLALAAIVVFVSDPIATLTPGFHLSFAAVVLLVWLARRRDAGVRAGGLLDPVRQLVVMQVFLMFGLLPLTAIIFQRFSLVATPVNLVAVPVFSFLVVPLTLLGLGLGDLSENAAEFALGLAARCIDSLVAGIAFAADLPMGHWSLAAISGGAFLVLLVPLAWVALPPGWPARRVAVLGVIALVAWKPPLPPAGCFDSWVLDVGQGLAVAIQTRHAVALYDTGIAWRGGSSSAEQVIVPFLRSRGIARIDRLIVSHSDLDHSGGVAVLGDELHVGLSVFGEPPAGDGWQCAAGQTWWSGAVRFEMLHPPMPRVVDGNDASCVLRVSAGPHALLLTGDIESGVERDLVRQRAGLGADVVIVPHHGSLTSSSVPFIDSVGADVAVVSAAHANRWGFPKRQVVDRWQTRGAELLTTARAGAVYLRICAADGVVELRREREERRRFWHADG